MIEVTQRIGEFFGYEVPGLVAIQTLGVMLRLCRTAARQPVTIKAAREITKDCTNYASKIAAVHNFVRGRVIFKHDPEILWFGRLTKTDYLKAPALMLTEIEHYGHTTEDCDGFADLTASLLFAAGVPAGFQAVATEKPRPDNLFPRLDHVFCIAKTEAGKKINVDASTSRYDWIGHNYREVWL